MRSRRAFRALPEPRPPATGGRAGRQHGAGSLALLGIVSILSLGRRVGHRAHGRSSASCSRRGCRSRRATPSSCSTSACPRLSARQSSSARRWPFRARDAGPVPQPAGRPRPCRRWGPGAGPRGHTAAIVLGAALRWLCATGLASTSLRRGLFRRPGITTHHCFYRLSDPSWAHLGPVMLLGASPSPPLAGALSGILKSNSPTDAQLRNLTFWGPRSLAGANWKKVASLPAESCSRWPRRRFWHRR